MYVHMPAIICAGLCYPVYFEALRRAGPPAKESYLMSYNFIINSVSAKVRGTNPRQLNKKRAVLKS